MTREEIHEIASKSAKEAVHETLTAIGFDMDHLHEEQQVWAFARQMHQGTRRGVRALMTGALTAFATLIMGWIWYAFNWKH